MGDLERGEYLHRFWSAVFSQHGTVDVLFAAEGFSAGLRSLPLALHGVETPRLGMFPRTLLKIAFIQPNF